MFKSKLKKWLGNGVTVLLLVIGLVLWISLPWIGVLVLAGAPQQQSGASTDVLRIVRIH